MADELLGEVKAPQSSASRITVAGIGGGGSNAVNHMYEEGITGVNFMVCNTDDQALEKSPVRRKILLGDGSGAGNDPKVGRDKAVMAEDEIKACFESLKTEMLFLTAGMGGGTGTGASPVIAKIAREMGILTVAIVTTPKRQEGPKRRKQADTGIQELSRYIDSMLIIENDNISKIYGKESLFDGFSRADEVLTKAAKGIAELITIPGEHNVDFADVRNILSNSGRAHLSVSKAMGSNRISELVDKALHSPLMDKSIAGARDAIVNISAASFRGDGAITQDDFDEILDAIREAAGTDSHGEDVNIIWGTTEKPELGDTLELVLVAANFDDSVGDGEEKFDSRRNEPPTGGPVLLGNRTSRYANIDHILRVPAYQRRGFKMVETVAKASNSEIVRDAAFDSRRDKKQSENEGNTLFDNQ